MTEPTADERDAIQASLGPEARGELANLLLTNPAFEAAIAEIERVLMTEWGDSQPDEAAKREQLFHRLKAVRELRDTLGAFERDGRFARRARERANTTIAA